MSWSIRDYRNQKSGVETPIAPPQQFHDDMPLPTYMAGLEAYEHDDVPPISQYQRRLMYEQGLLTEREITFWARLMRRGIDEI